MNAICGISVHCVWAGILATGLTLSAGASAAPPKIEGNRGIPGLLFEIARLEGQLSATQHELSTTRTVLTQTQYALSATSSELEASRIALNETLENLEREQNTYRVPRTGQDECWEWTIQPDVPHYTIPCAGSGQDGEKRAGLDPPLNRFVDNGDGTFTDRFTRLVWLARADCANDWSWFDALGLARQLSGLPEASLCSLRDGSLPGQWRMPNIHELLSLANFGTVDTSGGPDRPPFIGGAETFWSSTTYPIPSDFVVTGLYPCRSIGYGRDNWQRFNDAYIFALATAEVTHAPKQQWGRITRRHGTWPDIDCLAYNFESGTPTLGPSPRFIAVREWTESAKVP